MARSNDCRFGVMTEQASPMSEEWADVADSKSYYMVYLPTKPWRSLNVFGLIYPLTITLAYQATLNALAELGYRVISCFEASTELLWTLRRGSFQKSVMQNMYVRMYSVVQ